MVGHWVGGFWGCVVWVLNAPLTLKTIWALKYEVRKTTEVIHQLVFVSTKLEIRSTPL